MDPFTLGAGVLGAGGSIISAIMGGSAQDDANAMNYAIAQMNIRAQQKQQQAAQDYADKIRGEQHLGATDALGNRTHFVEGKGWVTDLDPQQQALYDYFFKQELPERQQQFLRQAQSSRDTGDVANQLLQQFQRVRKPDAQDAADQLYSVASRGISEGARDVSETAMRQATRTGNNNIGDIISKLGAATMKQRGDARVDSNIQGEDFANKQYAQERGGLAQLFGAFLGQSNQQLNPSYDPSGIPQSANSLMNVFSNQAQQGNSMGFNAAMQPAPQMGQVKPMMGSANTFGAIGSALSGLGDKIGSANRLSDQNDLMRQYISQGGQFGPGGIYASAASRLRGDTGTGGSW